VAVESAAGHGGRMDGKTLIGRLLRRRRRRRRSARKKKKTR
jgi:hypothetical protein